MNLQELHKMSMDAYNTKAVEFMENAKKTLFDDKKGVGSVSDGYHTFDELYNHRATEFAVICRAYPYLAWKSLQHDDPEFPMYDGMFIVGIKTPMGQATYHYDIDPWWDVFSGIEILEQAPEYDGYTPNDVIERLKSLSDSNGWLPVGDMSDIPYFQGILVYCPERNNKYMVYRNARDEWRIWDESAGGHSALTEQITHWKPLGLSPGK